MATATITKQKKARINPWLIVGGIVIALAIGAALFILNRPQRAGANSARVGNQATTTVSRGSIIGTVSGSGTITADQTLDVAFQTSGNVQQVLVQEGDAVKKDQPLATLDARTLEAQVANAEAALASAQARLKQSQQGNATPEQIAASEAALASAQANYDKVAAGATQTELTAAQAEVNSAQAAYNAALKASESKGSNLEAAFAQVQKAENAVQQAQAAYDRIGGASNPDIGRLPQSKDLQNATVDYQQALADYNALLTTSGPDAQAKIVSALSTLQAAKKRLTDLQVTPDELAAAKSNLEQAKSNLAKLNAPASESDIAIQQAAVQQAEQSLKQAQLNSERATLTAPFGGVITNINIVPGSSSNGIAMTLVNRDPLHVEMRLSENDVVKVEKGMSVQLTIDSINDWKAQGTVSYIAAVGEISNGVVTYPVRVDLPDNDARVKVGMTSNVDIIISQRDNVLVVPNTALLPSGTGRVVQVVNADNTTKKVEVQIGITDGSVTEILSGVNEGDTIIALPSSGTPQQGTGGPFGG